MKPRAKPIKTATASLCDQDACSNVISLVNTANSTDKATRISQGSTVALEKVKEKNFTANHGSKTLRLKVSKQLSHNL